MNRDKILNLNRTNYALIYFQRKSTLQTFYSPHIMILHLIYILSHNGCFKSTAANDFYLYYTNGTNLQKPTSKAHSFHKIFYSFMLMLVLKHDYTFWNFLFTLLYLIFSVNEDT